MVGNDSRFKSGSASVLKRQISVRVEISENGCIVWELIKEWEAELVEQLNQRGSQSGCFRHQFKPLIYAEREGSESAANCATIFLHEVGYRFLPFNVPNARQKNTEIHGEFAVIVLADAGNDVVFSDRVLAHLEIHNLNKPSLCSSIVSPALFAECERLQKASDMRLNCVEMFGEIGLWHGDACSCSFRRLNRDRDCSGNRTRPSIKQVLNPLF